MTPVRWALAAILALWALLAWANPPVHGMVHFLLVVALIVAIVDRVGGE